MKCKLKIIRLLGRLEYGFCVFLHKKSQQAKAEGNYALAFQLERHARQEDGHAKMLWGLLDGSSRPRRNSDTTVLIKNQDYFVAQPITQYSNHKQQLQSLDGISKRYKVAQFFFAGKSAAEYPWEEALAFMAAGELVSGLLYTLIATLIFDDSKPEQAIFLKIADEELGHSDYLLDALIDKIGIIKAYCQFLKWLLKLFLSSVFAVHELTEVL